MSMPNTRMRIGLSNVVYSILDDTTDYAGNPLTYGTVYPLPGAVALTFDRGSSMANVFGDDGSFSVGETVGEMKLGLELNDLLPADYARILGFTYSSGMIAEGINDASPYIAIGFKTLRMGKNSGAAVYEYFWLPKTIFQKPKNDEKTKDKSLAPRTVKLDGEAIRTITNDKYIVRARGDDPNVAAATISGWFTAPLYSATQSLTAVTVGTITGDSGAKTLTIPFAKSGETFSLQAPTDADIEISVVSTGLILAGTRSYVCSAAGTAPTIIASCSVLTAVPHLVTITSHVKDSNGVSVTRLSQLVTPA
jgi:phi13 family phage major tail protein